MNLLTDIFLYSILASVITWAIFGLIVGMIAYFFKPHSSGGFLLTVATATLGSLTGGFLASIVFGTRVSGFDLQSLIVAGTSALMLIVIQRTLVNTNN